MSDDKIPSVQEVAQGIHHGTIFSSIQIPPHDESMLPMVFMVLVFMNDDDHPKEDEMVMVWEYMAKANYRSINGYPTFFSCHTEDRERAQAIVTCWKRLVLKDKATTPEEKAEHELKFWRGE